jgi:putative AdoMet-dependent methyltransferase
MTDFSLRAPTARIGDLIDQLGLAARAIRFYEERGLIKPRRDRLNRRVYDPQSRIRLELIAYLRRANVSLDQIEALLLDADDGRSRSQAAGLLEARRAELIQQFAELDAVEAWMDQQINLEPRRSA